MSEEVTHRKKWIELSFRIDPVAREALSAFLFDLGSTGIVSEDFGDPALRAYFPSDCDPEAVASRTQVFLEELGRVFTEMRRPVWAWQRMEDEDWSLAWRRFFHPTRITPNLLILPAWETPAADETGHIIRIDPGLAFGTGQHPTTQMCLKALERASSNRGAWSMLDLGTGSGLLAIYGVLLGAEPVLALDVDEDALAWAARNLELNFVQQQITLSKTPVEDCRENFDVVAANLIFGEIMRLLPHLPRLLAPEGLLILSGLLDSQLNEVARASTVHGLVVQDTLLQDEWGCLLCSPGEKG